MKTFTKLFLVALLMFFFLKQNTLFSQVNYSVWSDNSGINSKNTDSKRVLPLKYRGLKLNLNSFRNILNTSPFEFSDRSVNSPQIIELPMPDGSLSKFYVTEYSMMEPGLASQFPEIKTYSVKGIDDPFAVGKIDVTALGFHGMVLTPNGDYFIDPVSLDNTEDYISFYKSDYRSNYLFECLVTEENINPDIINNSTLDMTGQQLRTYRLACAATGEYTAVFGGTVAAGQAAIVTSINRVNGVYERDLSVRMTLVANNTSIVYTNGGTDPYTNNNGGTMLTQNQSNLTTVIGSANYDIGHVFSTGGGGVAGLGVVCNSTQKARGVTGSPSPLGDPFDIDYVAHEMGHQFGGNHSFNGNAGNCAGGNRNASTAWEPGSASTIMGYAGICSPQDLQPNSDALFHIGNVGEITAFTQTGGGNSCPVITNTGNTPPTVTVPAGGFTIPISTPFALTGSATDTETPGALTYIWEEMDLGAAGAPTAPVGNAPIFRSFTPVASPTRTFPKLSDLLNNTSTIGEILPTYTRALNFRLTARDNNVGGGGINFNTVSFNVSNAAGPFVVTQPNTNVTWNAGAQTVTWNVANTTAAPVSVSLVNILLSTDGGNTFPTTLLSNTSNDGSESVVIPGVNTTLARIQVQSVGNIFFDISNTNFTIANTNAPGINHVQLTDMLKTAWPATVTSTVTSSFPLDSVWVNWNINSVTLSRQFKLINTSGNIYSEIFNSVNSDVNPGDVIYYKITAQNNSAGHEVTSTSVYNFSIIDGSLREGFFSGTFPPSGWSFEFSGTNYWSRVTQSSFGIGTGSAKYDFWNAQASTGSQSLITKTFGNTVAGDSLKFDNAYAPYTDGSTDSLEVLTSTNGGTSYSQLVKFWGNNVNGTMNTAGASGTAYTPTSGQWVTRKYSLPAGTNKIKFRARSGYGNNLYLDSICVLNTAPPAAVASNIKLAQEGYYDTLTNRLSIRDTARFYLRNISAPFAIIDSGKAVVDSLTLTAAVTFPDAQTGTYYVVARGWNTLETWSKNGGESYTRGSALNYDFTTVSSQAYGNNMILRGSKYCIYSGEVIQDGSIELADLLTIYNDANNFATGYIKNDLTGDRFVDLSDILIVYNNSSNFVVKEAPPGAGPAVIVRNNINIQEMINSLRKAESKYEESITLDLKNGNQNNDNMRKGK